MSLCDSKILSQKISIKLNNVFYNFGPFIVLEPLSLFLVKSSNLELYLTFLCRRFNLSAVLQQPLSKMPVAEKIPPSKFLILRLNAWSVPQMFQCQYLPL